MKIVDYYSEDCGACKALFLCKGDDGDLLLVPASKAGECPSIVMTFFSKPHNRYEEGNWTNISKKSYDDIINALTEFKKNKCKLPVDKEYELYLKLKEKYENI
jgi:hypothetical protein